MNETGSLQLQRYRSARRNHRSMTEATIEAGIGLGEAKLIEADEARAAAAEGREMWARVETPAATTPITAPEEGAQPKDEDMPRGKKNQGTINGEVPKPDFELAAKIYREDIRPAMSGVGEHAQEMSTAYKAIKKQAHIQPQAARLAFRLVDMEAAKRDDFLRSFNGLLREMKIFMPADLVDAAEGKGGENVVPIGEATRPQPATIPPAVEGNVDLADGADTTVADEHQHAAE